MGPIKIYLFITLDALLKTPTTAEVMFGAETATAICNQCQHNGVLYNSDTRLRLLPALVRGYQIFHIDLFSPNKKMADRRYMALRRAQILQAPRAR